MSLRDTSGHAMLLPGGLCDQEYCLTTEKNGCVGETSIRTRDLLILRRKSMFFAFVFVLAPGDGSLHTDAAVYNNSQRLAGKT